MSTPRVIKPFHWWISRPFWRGQALFLSSLLLVSIPPIPCACAFQVTSSGQEGHPTSGNCCPDDHPCCPSDQSTKHDNQAVQDPMPDCSCEEEPCHCSHGHCACLIKRGLPSFALSGSGPANSLRADTGALELIRSGCVNLALLQLPDPMQALLALVGFSPPERSCFHSISRIMRC